MSTKLNVRIYKILRKKINYLRGGDPLRDRLRCRGDLDRRVLDRERLLDREIDLRFFRALSRSSFSFKSFSKAAKGSSITLKSSFNCTL